MMRSKDSTSKMLNAFKIESIINKKNIGYEKSLLKPLIILLKNIQIQKI